MEGDFLENNKIKLFIIFMVIALIVAFIFRLPVEPFLEYDAKDVVLSLSGIVIGTPLCFLLIIIVTTLEFFMVAFTGAKGFIMNISSTLMFVCIAVYIYNVKSSKKSIRVGFIISSFISCFIMIFYNYILSMYMGYSRIEATNLIFTYILPFNVIKCTVNALIVILSYKPILNVLKHYNLIKENIEKEHKNKISNIIVIISIFFIIVTPIILTFKSYL